jgi:hypothetical protein
MVEEVPTNQRAADEQERFVPVGATFVIDAKPPVSVEPRQCVLINTHLYGTCSISAALRLVRSPRRS